MLYIFIINVFLKQMKANVLLLLFHMVVNYVFCFAFEAFI